MGHSLPDRRMFPLGIALRNSGGAELISDGLISLLEPFGTVAIPCRHRARNPPPHQPIHNAAVAVIHDTDRHRRRQPA